LKPLRFWCRALLLWGGLLLGASCTQGRRPAPPPADSAAARSFYADRFSRRATVAEMTELGRALFVDPSLSASGQMSCATCHDPRFAFGPPDDRPTQLGGPDLKTPGLRAVPSLRYLQTLPPFQEHHFDESVEDSADQGPTGGHGWDGRADTTHDQARLPLTSPFEMANPDMAAVVARVARGPLAARFRSAFGGDVFDDAQRAETAVLKCLEVFQQSPKDFYPYSSRYDAVLRGQARLTAAEQRGLALFDDPRKGNCASCHPSQIRKGSFPQFTDFGFNALGVPRNRRIAANRATRTWACAGRCAATWPRTARTAASSGCPHCATWRRAGSSSTTASSIRWRTCWTSTRGATPTPRSSTERSRAARASTSTTTCRPPTGGTSTAARPSAAGRASRRR
jgi:cytochrome c peroxidase